LIEIPSALVRFLIRVSGSLGRSREPLLIMFVAVMKYPLPNQSPEPTPISHRSSAVAVNVANTARLSFGR
ncbi:MAG: hypothetical protein JWO95_1849, partial [Verrucomicrobiales bacterium]|nr:hypothetical protein [Verrucomicrobiales bacterium]